MSEGAEIAALVLAAGDSRRMGVPKALLRIGDGTFLERIVAVAAAARLAPVRVVVGRHGAAILDALPSLQPVVVRNPEPDLGQLHSLRLGLAALPAPPDGVVVFLVDHPFVRVETVRALVAANRRERAAITVPVFAGRRGHPVLFPAAVFDALRTAPLDGGARAVVNANGQRVLEVEVDDPGVVTDVDTPEDYRRGRGCERGD